MSSPISTTISSVVNLNSDTSSLSWDNITVVENNTLPEETPSIINESSDVATSEQPVISTPTYNVMTNTPLNDAIEALNDTLIEKVRDIDNAVATAGGQNNNSATVQALVSIQPEQQQPPVIQSQMQLTVASASAPEGTPLVIEPASSVVSNLDLDADDKNVTVGPRTWNIYVGELPPNVTEEQIKQKFTPCGEIRGVNIIRDKVTSLCRGYAFVHFEKPEAYNLALSPQFSNLMISGQPARVKPSDNKQTLFIGNVPMDMSSTELKAALLDLCKGIADGMQVELKSSSSVGNLSRGFCFVTFNSYETAEAAKKVLMSAVVRDRQLNVSWAESSNRSAAEDDPNSKVTTLYISNIGPNVQEETLMPIFSQLGEVTKCVVVKTPSGENRGYGFVTYKDRETCLQATKQLHNMELDGQRICVTFAKTSSSSTGSGSSNLKMRGSRNSQSADNSRNVRHNSNNAYRVGSVHHPHLSGGVGYNALMPNWSAPFGQPPGSTQAYYLQGELQQAQASYQANSAHGFNALGGGRDRTRNANPVSRPSPSQHHVAPSASYPPTQVPPVPYSTYNSYPTSVGWYPPVDANAVPTAQYPHQANAASTTANTTSVQASATAAHFPPYSYDSSYYYFPAYNQQSTGLPAIQTPSLGASRYPY